MIAVCDVGEGLEIDKERASGDRCVSHTWTYHSRFRKRLRVLTLTSESPMFVAKQVCFQHLDSLCATYSIYKHQRPGPPFAMLVLVSEQPLDMSCVPVLRPLSFWQQ